MSLPAVALVLGGGNALGAYAAGAIRVLWESGRRPDWIVGASVGAVTAAILAGNPPDRALERLAQFWAEATQKTGAFGPVAGEPRRASNALHSLMTLTQGRPTIFQHRYPGLFSALPFMPDDVALFDHAPLRRTLSRLVDFDRLNGGDTRLTVATVDIATGAEVAFDTRRDRIGPDHILASTSLPPAFPPVSIGDRLLCDPGYTNNCPIDYVLGEPPEADLLCVAIELFGLAGTRPTSLDQVLERTTDLIFASATARTVAALERYYALLARTEPEGPAATLLHLAYRAGPDELASKSFEFSPSSVAERDAAGARDMTASLARLEARPEAGRLRYLGPP